MSNLMLKIQSRIFTRRGFLVGIIIIAGVALAACNDISTPEPKATATPFHPQVTETSPAYETPVVSETPFMETGIPTETMQEGEISPKRMAYIVTNVNAFINSEGRFSDEELLKSPYWFDLSVGDKELPLGLLDPIHAQVILLDYEVVGEYLVVFMGTNDRDGKRIVFEYANMANNQFWTEIRISGLPNFNGFGDVRVVKLDEIETILDEYLGQPMILAIMPYLGKLLPITEEREKQWESLGCDIDLLLENHKVIESEGSIDYFADLYNLISVVEKKYGDNQYQSVLDEQNVTYFSADEMMDIGDIEALSSTTVCGNMNFLFRK